MRKSPDNSEALAAFIARKTEIDTILTRLAALSAEHFDRAPDDISWSAVGTLGVYERHPRGRVQATLSQLPPSESRYGNPSRSMSPQDFACSRLGVGHGVERNCQV
jgi:hypothetical protein